MHSLVPSALHPALLHPPLSPIVPLSPVCPRFRRPPPPPPPPPPPHPVLYWPALSWFVLAHPLYCLFVIPSCTFLSIGTPPLLALSSAPVPLLRGNVCPVHSPFHTSGPPVPFFPHHIRSFVVPSAILIPCSRATALHPPSLTSCFCGRVLHTSLMFPLV